MPSCVLAIETSTPEGQVAVWRDGQVVYHRAFASQRSHNSQLFGPLAEALELCGGGGDLTLIVAGTGPGSYTGVRIGIAAAQGLAWSLGVPVMGLASLLTPDVEPVPTHYVVCGDARRGQFYAAEVRDGVLQAEVIPLMGKDEFLALREAQAAVPWFTLDAVAPAGVAGVQAVKPSAAHLAGLAAGMSAGDLAERTARLLEPVYLSAPFITTAKKKVG